MKDKTLEIISNSKLLSKGALAVLLYIYSIGGVWKKGQRALLQDMSDSEDEENWILQERQLVDVLRELEKWQYIKKEVDPEKKNRKIYKIKEEGGTNGK